MINTKEEQKEIFKLYVSLVQTRGSKPFTNEKEAMKLLLERAKIAHRVFKDDQDKQVKLKRSQVV